MRLVQVYLDAFSLRIICAQNPYPLTYCCTKGEDKESSLRAGFTIPLDFCKGMPKGYVEYFVA